MHAALLLSAIALASAGPVRAETIVGKNSNKAFSERAVSMQRASGPWYLDATAEGRLIFRRADGERMTRGEVLRAIGEPDLAQRQAAAELTENAMPFLLAFPLMVPPIVGLGLGGLRPSVRGDNLDVILEASWMGAAIGGLVGLTLSVATLAFGFLAVQWLRASDAEVTGAVAAYNKTLAKQLGLESSSIGAGFFGLASPHEAGAE